MNKEFLSISLLLIIIISLQVAVMAKPEEHDGEKRASCAAVVSMLVLEHQLTAHGLELGTNYCLGTSAVHFVGEVKPVETNFDKPCKWMRDCGPNLVCVQGPIQGYGVCKYGTQPK